MQSIPRLRIPALVCSGAVLLCELIARPYANMGICDDGPYIIMAQHLAATGHIVYNGWAAAMIVAQLYLGAAFIKLFGYSFTTVRMSTLLIAVLTAFVLQRTLVRAQISERNATIGTLALVLSPLYLMLSVTFMSDVPGLFAVILCLYGCLRALQSQTNRAAILWLCFAVVTNAICGTSRQIAWLGILVMVPSTLWLLRARRRVLLAGAAATFAGTLFILAGVFWLKHQPYVLPVPFLAKKIQVASSLGQLGSLLLDLPFLMLPVMVPFLLGIRKTHSRTLAIIAALSLAFVFLVTYPSHLRGPLSYLLEPINGDWVSTVGIHTDLGLHGSAPLFLGIGVQILLTLASFGSLIALLASFFPFRKAHQVEDSVPGTSLRQLGVLLAPFTIAYALLLVNSAAPTGRLFDRYLLGIQVVALLCIVRYYQERIQPRLPVASVLLVAIMAIYGTAVTHNMFTFYRARVALAAQLRASGIPDTSVDNGWEYNFDVELQHTGYINEFRIELPANAYVPPSPAPVGTCAMPEFWRVRTPHIHPIYSISFDPNACYGPAPFAPIHYSRWPGLTPGTLYVVRSTAGSNP